MTDKTKSIFTKIIEILCYLIVAGASGAFAAGRWEVTIQRDIADIARVAEAAHVIGMDNTRRQTMLEGDFREVKTDIRWIRQTLEREIYRPTGRPRD